jgi:MFS family permease
VYLGVALGSYLQSFSDQYGRKVFIAWAIIIQSIFGLISCICWNFSSFLVARFFYGVAMGIGFPLSGTYISEISPAAERTKLLIYTRYFFSGGAILTCLLGWYMLKTNSWRILLFLICLPGIYAYWEHRRMGRESLKYLWIHKR